VLFVLLACFWIVYGITVGSWEIVAGSLFALPLQLLILYRLRPRVRCHVGVRSLVLVSLCCAGPALWWGWSGTVIGVGGASSFTRLPQLIRLVREREAAGVSVGSWSMAVLVSALGLSTTPARLRAVLIVTALAGTVSLVVAGCRGGDTRSSRLRDVANAGILEGRHPVSQHMMGPRVASRVWQTDAGKRRRAEWRTSPTSNST
jgi:uncharacterized protein with PQ loop repeat